MKRNFILLTTLLLSLFGYAQENEKLIAWQLIEQNKEATGFTAADLDNSILKSAYFNRHGGTWLVHLQQSHLSLPVYNQIHVLAFKNEKLVSMVGTRIGKIERLAGNNATPAVNPSEAVKTALASKGISEYEDPQGFMANGKWEFGNMGVCSETITAELMWLPVDENTSVKLVWEIRVVPLKSSGYFMIRVDAMNNKVINEDNLTVSCQWGPANLTSHDHHEHAIAGNNGAVRSLIEETPLSVNIVNDASYLVVPYPAESPKHPGGTPDTIVSPWKNFSGNAVSQGWHTIGSNDYSYTKGNNVIAWEDQNGTDGQGQYFVVSGRDSLKFISPPNFSLPPSNTANLRFALTNLFYWNNLSHDISYIHGFDEAAGNFQSSNQGRPGAGNDEVIADCQDGGGSNNANFATPPDGSNPKMQMYLWANKSIDGSLDNGVITHEYMHGISNRLTGGRTLSSCLLNEEQMGEGWSDYFSIMLTQNWADSDTGTGRSAPRSIGTYVNNDPINGPGIRTVKYCTDFSINNRKYANSSISNYGAFSDKYIVGELWCSTLWDMTWNIVKQTDSIDPDLFNENGKGGNSIALKLVIEGMKYQPCSPGLIDGRNGILRADTILFGGAYSCAIWKAFSRRGMGPKASQGSSSSVRDQKADESNYNPVNIFLRQDKPSGVPQGGTITYTITAISPCISATGFKIKQTLPSNVSYLSGGSYDSSNREVTFESDLEEGIEKNFQFSVRVNNGSYFTPYKLLEENIPSTTLPSNWSTTASPTTNIWKTTSAASYSPPRSFYATNYATTSDQKLISPVAVLPIGSNPTLTFWHRFNSELGTDGGIIEALINDSIWISLENMFIENGYNTRLNPSSNPLANRRAFSGSIDSFQKSTINLSSIAGNSVKFRFWFGSDNSNTPDLQSPAGWFVDDITLDISPVVIMRSAIFNSAGTLQDFADTITDILPCEFAEVSKRDSLQRVCRESDAILTFENKGTNNLYQWQVSNDKGQTFLDVQGANDDSLLLPNVSNSLDSILYRIIVSNACPSLDTSASVMLMVSEAVSINTQPSFLNVCEGSTDNMKVSASGGILGFQWQSSADGVNYNDITGANDSIINFSTVSATQDSSLYRVKIVSCNNAISLPANLFVINKADITQQPQSSWICSGSSLIVEAASAGDNLTYQWQVASKGSNLFQNIPGADSASLPIVANLTSDSSTYRLIARNSCNSADTSIAATISISDSVFILKQPSAVTLCNGLDTTLTVAIAGGRIAGYQWQKSSNGVDFTDTTGATSPTLVFNNIQTSELGKRYRLVIKACNDLISQSALLTVLSSPKVTNDPRNAQICENSNHLFSVSASGDGTSFRWQVSTDGGNSFRDTGTSTNSFAINAAKINNNNDLYRVIVSGTCAKPDTSSAAQLTVNTLITPLFGQSTRAVLKKVCAGETKSPLPSADDNNVAGTWTPSFNGNQKTTYTFKPNNTCSKTDTLTIDVEGCRFVSPNPVVNGSFVVYVPRGTANPGPYIIQMYDSKGARVLTQTMTSNRGTVYTSAFSAGIYIVTLWGNDGELIESERIFIRH